MKFAATVTRNVENGSLVEEVFSRDVKLCTEAASDAKVPAGHIALIGDYRGHTLASQRGRTARNAGETVVDLSAVSRIALSDIPNLVKRLSELAEEAPAALDTLAQMADEARAEAEAAAEAEAEAEDGDEG